MSFPFRESIAGTALSLLATGVLLVAPPAAIADDDPAPPPPAVDQYRENLPTAGSPSGGSDSKQPGAGLPPKVRAQLKASGTRDAQVLRQIATSPAYGAPQQQLPRTDSRAAASLPAHVQRAGSQALAERNGSTAGIAGTMRLLGLLVLMAAVLGTALVLARRRRAKGAAQLLPK